MTGKDKKSTSSDPVLKKNPARGKSAPMQVKTLSEREEHNLYIERQYAKKELALRKKQVEMFLRIFERAEALRGIQWSRDAVTSVEEVELQVEVQDTEIREEESVPAQKEPEQKEATIAELLESLGGISLAPGESPLALLEDDSLIQAAKNLLNDPKDTKTFSRLELLEKLIEQISRSSFRDSRERVLGEREKDRLLQIRQLLQYLRDWKAWNDRVSNDISAIVERREQKIQPKRKKR